MSSVASLSTDVFAPERMHRTDVTCGMAAAAVQFLFWICSASTWGDAQRKLDSNPSDLHLPAHILNCVACDHTSVPSGMTSLALFSPSSPILKLAPQVSATFLPGFSHASFQRLIL